MRNLNFKEVKEEDLKIIQKIYNFYIENTTATFHINKLSIEDLRELIPINHSRYKSYLICENDLIYGYCLISQYKNRQAYNRTAEITIYLKSEYTQKGIGARALKFLEEIAKKKKIRVLLSIISGENVSSIKLFERLRYDKCAHFKEVGEKFGRVIDVLAYQKILDK
ncbi:MAG: GNAT family N-acetyltransferase [Promethearchaeota archaeon]